MAVPLSKELHVVVFFMHLIGYKHLDLVIMGSLMSVVNNIKMGSIKPVKRNVPFVIIKFAK